MCSDDRTSHDQDVWLGATRVRRHCREKRRGIAIGLGRKDSESNEQRREVSLLFFPHEFRSNV